MAYFILHAPDKWQIENVGGIDKWTLPVDDITLKYDSLYMICMFSFVGVFLILQGLKEKVTFLRFSEYIYGGGFILLALYDIFQVTNNEWFCYLLVILLTLILTLKRWLISFTGT